MRTYTERWYGVAVVLAALAAGALTVQAAAPKTNAVADSLLAPPASVPVERMSLAEMKDEFALLMKKRAELGAEYSRSLSVIAGARSSQANNPSAGSGTGNAYREAALRVERALDEHPQVKALQLEYDVVETQKVAVSKEQSVIVAAWREFDLAEVADYRARVDAVRQKGLAAKADFFKSIDLPENPQPGKPVRELTESETNRLVAIQDQLTKEMNALKGERDVERLKSRAKEAHEKDGSAKKFDELMERYKALEDRQGELRSAMGALRDSLRKSDSTIAAMVANAVAESQAHLAAVDKLPHVADARQCVLQFRKARGMIDQRARLVRKAILDKDAEYKATLDAQAEAGGLAQVPEGFWKVNN